jgi:hypothetical protein
VSFAAALVDIAIFAATMPLFFWFAWHTYRLLKQPDFPPAAPPAQGNASWRDYFRLHFAPAIQWGLVRARLAS